MPNYFLFILKFCASAHVYQTFASAWAGEFNYAVTRAGTRDRPDLGISPRPLPDGLAGTAGDPLPRVGVVDYDRSPCFDGPTSPWGC